MSVAVVAVNKNGHVSRQMYYVKLRAEADAALLRLDGHHVQGTDAGLHSQIKAVDMGSSTFGFNRGPCGGSKGKANSKDNVDRIATNPETSATPG